MGLPRLLLCIELRLFIIRRKEMDGPAAVSVASNNTQQTKREREKKTFALREMKTMSRAFQGCSIGFAAMY